MTVSCLTDDGLIDESDLREVMKACMVENGMQFDEKEVASLANALFEDAVQVISSSSHSSANHRVLPNPRDAASRCSQYLVCTHRFLLTGRVRGDHGGRLEGPADEARGAVGEPDDQHRQVAGAAEANGCQEVLVSDAQVSNNTPGPGLQVMSMNLSIFYVFMSDRFHR